MLALAVVPSVSRYGSICSVDDLGAAALALMVSARGPWDDGQELGWGGRRLQWPASQVPEEYCQAAFLVTPGPARRGVWHEAPRLYEAELRNSPQLNLWWAYHVRNVLMAHPGMMAVALECHR